MHNVGTIISKKFYSIFFKKSRGPRFASEPDSFPLENCAGTVCLQTVWFPLGTMSPWSLHRNGAKSLIPKISSARGSKMPAGILRRNSRRDLLDAIARASPMGKVRSMRAFPINERACHYRLRCHWNYVGRHGADSFLLSYTRGLSGGQFTAVQCLDVLCGVVNCRLTVLVHTPLTDSSVHNHYTIIHKSIQQEKKQYETGYSAGIPR